jgi:hypothetical protein
LKEGFSICHELAAQFSGKSTLSREKRTFRPGMDDIEIPAFLRKQAD